MTTRYYILIASLVLFATPSRADLIAVDTSPSAQWDGFTTIAAPSSTDLAHNAFVTIETGSANSLATNIDPNLLTDGIVATNSDHFANSSDNNLNRVFFGEDTGTTSYRLMINLGGVHEIGAVNAYSWNDAGRSDQTYEVHYSEDFLPTVGDLGFNGWHSLGSFNTSGNSGDTQVATSLENGGPEIATAQFLIFSVEANSSGLGTYFTEIDVLAATAVPEPGSILLLLGGGMMVLTRRRKSA